MSMSSCLTALLLVQINKITIFLVQLYNIMYEYLSIILIFIDLVHDSDGLKYFEYLQK